MKTYRLGRVLHDNRVTGPRDARIYIVRDGSTVFYR